KERSGERRLTPTCSLLWILGGIRRRSPIRPKLPPSLRSLSHRSSDINSYDEDDDYFATISGGSSLCSTSLDLTCFR
ncbi:unnamed protein product, partial [Brassica napus]